MLAFKYKPDQVFSEILSRSFTACHDLPLFLNEVGYKQVFHHVSFTMSPEKTKKVFENIDFIHKSPDLYSINGYQWLCIFDALNFYCVIANDMGKTNPIIENTNIIEIDFERMAELYLLKGSKNSSCLTKEPSWEELEFKLIPKKEYTFLENDAPFFNSETMVYPDMGACIKNKIWLY
jgi:hypothetical protein